MTCPSCGAPCAVILFRTVDCRFPRCRHYGGPPDPPITDLDQRIGGDRAQAFVNWILTHIADEPTDPAIHVTP